MHRCHILNEICSFFNVKLAPILRYEKATKRPHGEWKKPLGIILMK
jgi:hypothetical protein